MTLEEELSKIQNLMKHSDGNEAKALRLLKQLLLNDADEKNVNELKEYIESGIFNDPSYNQILFNALAIDNPQGFSLATFMFDRAKKEIVLFFEEKGFYRILESLYMKEANHRFSYEFEKELYRLGGDCVSDSITDMLSINSIIRRTNE